MFDYVLYEPNNPSDPLAQRMKDATLEFIRKQGFEPAGYLIDDKEAYTPEIGEEKLIVTRTKKINSPNIGLVLPQVTKEV